MSDQELSLFKPRRRQKHLDLRPAIWSLQNRPEEWEWKNELLYVIRHRPSKVEMWVATGGDYVRVYESPVDADTKNKIGWLDRRRFWRAFKKWRQHHKPLVVSSDLTETNQRFSTYFIPAPIGKWSGKMALPSGEVIYEGQFPASADGVYAYMTAKRLAAE